MKFFLLLFLFVCSAGFSQSKEKLFKQDFAVLVEEMELMYRYDKLLRNYASLKTTGGRENELPENLLDSLGLPELPKLDFGDGDLRNHIYNNYIYPKDAEHTKRMISITKKYGFPTIKRIRQYTDKEFSEPDFNPFFLLQYAPQKYWKKLKKLMKKEYRAGRINQCDYGFLLWHFSLDKSFKPMLDNGYVMETRDGVPFLKPTCE
ncbi:hypothetical protein RM553_11450 [Zunongwangia sp. F363]|uniref:Uncharacterized protein n=1 Tax=Autumnicola tepida TaxID=3075595 RepID=A0ABU3CAS3_9FLAO|nr:hypothetical protein [Zunongwangia sp. F363]MDT0643447.1 hypothetical protein [Zunongwangia sp. F363]